MSSIFTIKISIIIFNVKMTREFWGRFDFRLQSNVKYVKNKEQQQSLLLWQKNVEKIWNNIE